MKKTWRKIVGSLIILLAILTAYGENQEKKNWAYSQGDYQFEWDFTVDKARMFQISTQKTIWKGSLLPAFWMQDNGQKKYIKATVVSVSTKEANGKIELSLQFADLGTGSLSVKKESWGVSINDFYLSWNDKIPEIIDLYFGTSELPEGRQSLMDESNPPFTSDWEAFGYCVPGAKEGTVQSYFRMWDFGQANIALGSFAPSMGTPYGAAFPRPVLALAMGSNDGMIVIGTGNVPDAPMTLKIRASLGCVNLLYREDLWGAGTKERYWENPLRLAFGENAWVSYQNYFNSFPENESCSSIHQKSVINTWGNWRNKEYPIRPMVDFAKKIGAETFVIDDPWEKSQGLGKPNMALFPDIHRDLEYIHQNNMTHGIWETLGWIGDTLDCGLSKEDLICDLNGNPCVGSWNFNPFATGYFCLDISTQHSRDFLKQRTIRTMKSMKPSLMKLDFGYGMPNPNIGVPKDPKLRGERYSYELMKLIVDAAKSVNPDVTIMYYGINPLYHSLSDMVSLDDQGDMWYAVQMGHDQWSIWASLLSDKQVAISGSSSYDWHTDDHVILNSFILGSPGSVLATHLDDGSPVPEKYLNRRLAINKWYRKTIQWKPLWLNSHLGDFDNPPRLNCWARTEVLKGTDQITALVLRGEKDKTLGKLEAFEWEGRWALVSQTDDGIFNTTKLALIPFDAGFISISLPEKPKSIEQLNINGIKTCEDWEWSNGKLTIVINKDELNQIAGFTIDLKNNQ